MRKTISIFFAGVAVICGLASCNKSLGTSEASGNSSVTEQSGEKARVKIAVSGSESSKADLQLEDESKVNNLQVLIFRGANIETYGTADASTLELNTTTGEKTVWAVVNAPDLSAIADTSALKATISNLSADNALNGFVMAGKTKKTLVVNDEVTINVDRYCSRVKVDKITRNMEASALQDISADKFQFIRAYVCEVADNYKMGFSAPDTYTWLSSELNSPAAIATDKPLIYNKLDTAYDMAEDASYETAQRFFVYPNPVMEDDANGKITRLILEFKIEDNFYTYPILIATSVSGNENGIEFNKSYEIRELVLTRLGNPSNGDDVIDPGENDPIVTSSMTFTVDVNDWTLVLLGDNGTVTI